MSYIERTPQDRARVIRELRLETLINLSMGMSQGVAAWASEPNSIEFTAMRAISEVITGLVSRLPHSDRVRLVEEVMERTTQWQIKMNPEHETEIRADWAGDKNMQRVLDEILMGK